MEIEIKFATSDHLPQILDIVNHYIQHDTCIYDIESRTPKIQLEWFENQQKNGYPVIVALRDQEIIGYASYSLFRPKVGYKFSMEHSIYLRSNQLFRGTGTLLMNQLIELAKENNIHSLIGGIDANNSKSIQFHEKFGFNVVGRMNEVGFKFNRWLDLVWMQKII